MKKRTTAAVILTTLVLATGCGPKPLDTTTSAVVETTAETTKAAAETAAEADTSQEAAAQPQAQETSEITGTIDEIKDFMFTIVEDGGEAYPLSFDAEPEGLSDVQNGDKVTVTYTGDLSREEAFTGTIVSVKKAE